MDVRRRFLVVPVAIVLTAMWLASGVSAVVTGNVNAFVIASGPFGLLCGYLFGISVIRKPGDG